MTNLAGIVVVAMLIFIRQRYGEWRKALLALIAIVISSVVLVHPLHQALHELYVKNRVIRLAVKLAAARPEIISGSGKVESLNVRYRDGVLHVYANVFTRRERMENLQGRLDKFRESLSADVGEAVVVDITLIPV